MPPSVHLAKIIITVFRGDVIEIDFAEDVKALLAQLDAKPDGEDREKSVVANQSQEGKISMLTDEKTAGFGSKTGGAFAMRAG